MAEHGTPQGECLICCEDLVEENYAEYRATDSSGWLASPYCCECLESFFKARQWQQYLDHVHKADCAAALRRVLSKPVPERVSDRGLPCEGSPTGEVHSFWYMGSGEVVSSRLVGAPEGEARVQFAEDMQRMLDAFVVAESVED